MSKTETKKLQKKEYEKKEGFPPIKSWNSKAARSLTKELYAKYKDIKTKQSNYTFDKCIIASIEYDDQSNGIYAGDSDCYKEFSEVFDGVAREYHNIPKEKQIKHVKNHNMDDIKLDFDKDLPVISTRARVSRNIDGFPLQPGLTQAQREKIELMMQGVLNSLTGELKGRYYSLKDLTKEQKEQMVKDHFLFIADNPKHILYGIRNDWPLGRGIYFNDAKTFLVWVNEEDQIRIIAMEKGGNIKKVVGRLILGINEIEKGLKKLFDAKYAYSEKYGYYSACPTNIGTGLRASIHIDLGALQKKYKSSELKKMAADMHLQLRGEYGDATVDGSSIFDVSNLYRLGMGIIDYTNILIKGCNEIWKLQKEAAKKK